MKLFLIGILLFAVSVFAGESPIIWGPGCAYNLISQACVPTTGGGTVTSVGLTVPSFLSVTGSPITSSGTIDLTYSGTPLPVANGGTGATTANAAFNSLVPSQSGNSGKFLTTDGTNTSWASGGGITWSTPVDANIVPDAPDTRNIGGPGSQFTIVYTRYLFDGSNNPAINVFNKFLYNDAGQIGISFGDNQLRVGNTGGRFDWSSLNVGNAGDVLVNTDGAGTLAWQAPSGGGITWATPVDSDITPDTDSAYKIGATGSNFLEVWTKNINSDLDIDSLAPGHILFHSSGDQIYLQANNSIELRTNGAAGVELHLRDADQSNFVGFKSPDTLTVDTTYTMPLADGTSGQVLSTDGAGNLSWATAGGGGGIATYANFAALPGSASNFDLGITLDDGVMYTYSTDDNLWHKLIGLSLGVGGFYSATDNKLMMANNRHLLDENEFDAVSFGADTNGRKLWGEDGTELFKWRNAGITFATSMAPNGDGTLDIGNSSNPLATLWTYGVESSYNLFINSDSGPIEITPSVGSQTGVYSPLKIGNVSGIAQELRFYNNGETFYTGFKAPASLAANKIYTLPLADGTNGQVLSTNGSGTLSWASPGGGGITWSTPVNANVVPDTDRAYNLGSAANRFETLYIYNIKDNSGVQVLNAQFHYLYDSSGNGVVSLNQRSLVDTSGAISVAWSGRSLSDPAGNSSLDWSSTSQVSVQKPFVFVNLASDPGSPVAGMVYYNTSINKLKVYNGSAWEVIQSL